MRLVIEESKEILTTHAGLYAVGELLRKTKLRSRLNAIRLAGRPEPEISHGDVAVSYIGLLCQGKNDFDHIEAHREDDFFRRAMGVRVVPSSPTLRQQLDEAAGQAGWEAILREESAHLLARKARPTAVTVGGRDLVPLDIDVSPWDNSGTKKEGVSRTYHGYDGYAPIFAFLGVEGFVVHSELRPGKDHSQKGTTKFLRESIIYARSVTGRLLLLRLDAGFDSRDNILICRDARVEFIIKRNLRGESESVWLEWAKRHGSMREPRPGKRVWRGALVCDVEGKPVRMIVEAVERTTRANGQVLLLPEVEVQAWWTSLPDDPDTVIRLYQEHGTMEQFHSEIKTDLDLERLPSGKLATNNLVLQFALLAYNILRLMGQAMFGDPTVPLRKARQRRRIRTVIKDPDLPGGAAGGPCAAGAAALRTGQPLGTTPAADLRSLGLTAGIPQNRQITEPVGGNRRGGQVIPPVGPVVTAGA